MRDPVQLGGAMARMRWAMGTCFGFGTSGGQPACLAMHADGLEGHARADRRQDGDDDAPFDDTFELVHLSSLRLSQRACSPAAMHQLQQRLLAVAEGSANLGMFDEAETKDNDNDNDANNNDDRNEEQRLNHANAPSDMSAPSPSTFTPLKRGLSHRYCSAGRQAPANIVSKPSTGSEDFSWAASTAWSESSFGASLADALLWSRSLSLKALESARKHSLGPSTEDEPDSKRRMLAPSRCSSRTSYLLPAALQHNSLY